MNKNYALNESKNISPLTKSIEALLSIDDSEIFGPFSINKLWLPK